MYRVDWLQSALDELAAIWTTADSSRRAAVTAATDAIEQRLKLDAANEGESRTGGRRITFAAPLAVTFQSSQMVSRQRSSMCGYLHDRGREGAPVDDGRR